MIDLIIEDGGKASKKGLMREALSFPIYKPQGRSLCPRLIQHQLHAPNLFPSTCTLKVAPSRACPSIKWKRISEGSTLLVGGGGTGEGAHRGAPLFFLIVGAERPVANLTGKPPPKLRSQPQRYNLAHTRQKYLRSGPRWVHLCLQQDFVIAAPSSTEKEVIWIWDFCWLNGVGMTTC